MKKLSIFLLVFNIYTTSIIAQEKDSLNEKSIESRSKIIVYTKTGDVFKGYFISQDKDFLRLDTDSAGTITIPTNRIKNIEIPAEDSQENANEALADLEQINPVRYVIGTSAFNYQRGVSYIRNNPMTYHTGITDNFSIGLGTSLWALVFGVPTLYLNPQYTAQIVKNLNLKVGLDAFAASDLDSGNGAVGALVNTGVTLGNTDLNITGTVYYGGIAEFGEIKPILSFAGMARFSKKMFAVGETFFPTSKDLLGLSTYLYGLRYLNTNGSYDVGFVYNQQIADFLPFGFPYVAITVKL